MAEEASEIGAPAIKPVSATIPCPECDGKGATSARAGHCFDIDGGLWHEPGKCSAPECHGGRCCPPCRRCHGSGQIERRHYAYCKDVLCPGCLPTIAEIKRFPLILDVFAEMLARAIPQSPETNTREGAVAAIAANEREYRSVAWFAHRHHVLVKAVEWAWGAEEETLITDYKAEMERQHASANGGSR